MLTPRYEIARDIKDIVFIGGSGPFDIWVNHQRGFVIAVNGNDDDAWMGLPITDGLITHLWDPNYNDNSGEVKTLMQMPEHHMAVVQFLQIFAPEFNVKGVDSLGRDEWGQDDQNEGVDEVIV